MPDQFECLNCDYRWFPRYSVKRRSKFPQKCPNCHIFLTKDNYKTLKWHEQGSGCLGLGVIVLGLFVIFGILFFSVVY